MGRQALISYSLVKEIADAFYEARGESPTNDDLRAALRDRGCGKGGSNSTVSGFLRQWKREHGLLPEEPTDDPAVTVLRELRVQYQEEADRRVAEMQADANQKIDAAQLESQEARTLAEQLTVSIADVREVLLRSEKKLSDTRELLVLEQSAREHAERKVVDLVDVYKHNEFQLHQELDRVRTAQTDATEKHERVRSELETRITELMREIQQNQAKFADKLRACESDISKLQAQLESEKDKAASLSGQLVDLSNELRILKERRDDYERLLAAKQGENAELRSNVAVLTERHGALQETESRLNNELTQTRTRIHTLETSLDGQQQLVLELQKKLSEQQ